MAFILQSLVNMGCVLLSVMLTSADVVLLYVVIFIGGVCVLDVVAVNLVYVAVLVEIVMSFL